MIQPLAIEKYCDAIKDKIIFEKFNLDTFITGEKVKNLSKVPQINAFVIRKIFDKWKKEADKLKSPFFDFEHPDVKKALKEFMNKLSFQIKIEKDYFEVILKEAIHDAFEYLENPVYFLQEEVFKFTGTELTKDQIKARIKFLKLFPNRIQLFLDHPDINKGAVRLDVLMKTIEDVFDVKTNIDEEKAFIEQLTTIVPNNFINLEETKPAFEIPKKHIEEKEPELTISKPEDVPLEINEPIEEQRVYEMPNFDTESGTKISIAPISSVSEAITLQQKFYFIKELFDNDHNMFQSVVDKTDSFNSYDEACNTLWEAHAEKLNWMEKEEAVSEFFSIINRKFI